MLKEIAWTLTHGKLKQRRLHRSLPSRETVCVKIDGYCQIKYIYLYAPYLRGKKTCEAFIRSSSPDISSLLSKPSEFILYTIASQ